jgi:hypothetical protein
MKAVPSFGKFEVNNPAAQGKVSEYLDPKRILCFPDCLMSDPKEFWWK